VRPAKITPRLVRTEDTAVYLGVSQWKLRDITRREEIPRGSAHARWAGSIGRPRPGCLHRAPEAAHDIVTLISRRWTVAEGRDFTDGDIGLW
jgi:hypothetical protein